MTKTTRPQGGQKKRQKSGWTQNPNKRNGRINKDDDGGRKKTTRK